MPTRYREAQGRFRKLLQDLNEADPRILRLFPSLNPQRRLMPQVRKGLETDLRVLMVAAENGFVNHQVLKDDYAVGGDSRKRALPRLLELGLLTRSEQVSEKHVRKDVYHLSGKGLLLCAAFPQIFKSEAYVSLMKKYVTNRSLANTMLLLYRQPASDGSNRLLGALHWVSDRGFNLENLPEEALAERLLNREEFTEEHLRQTLLDTLVRWFLDAISTSTDEQFEGILRDVSTFVRWARSRPLAAKVGLTLEEEIDQLARSTDLLVWLKARRALGIPITHIFEIFRESFSGLGDLEAHDEAFWDDKIRKQVFPEIRRRLHEETLSMTRKLETSTLEEGA